MIEQIDWISLVTGFGIGVIIIGVILLIKKHKPKTNLREIRDKVREAADNLTTAWKAIADVDEILYNAERIKNA